jgi:predicted NBD/HSP70 family sugar kinase
VGQVNCRGTFAQRQDGWPVRINDQELNRLKVLKAIRRTEPVARTELVALTGLAGGTITDITADLLKRRVILESKVSSQGRGRPRLELRLNPKGPYLVAASFHFDGSLSVEIINLRGDRVFERTSKLRSASTLEAMARETASIVDSTIQVSPYSKENLERVGLTLPALLDGVNGIVHWFPTYPAKPSPVARIIQQRLQLPVVIDNSANVLARAEHWFGSDQELDDFSLIHFDELGMGSARYVDGMLFAGANGINPEFSHIKVSIEHGRKCYCGATGCLSAHCSVPSLVKQICELRGRRLPTASRMISLFHDFVSDARAGKSDARKIFDRAGQLLGTAIANHINASDPGKIIIATFDTSLSELLSNEFLASLKKNTLAPLLERTSVQFKTIAEDHYLKGSAALVLEQIFRSPPSR